MRIKNIDFIDVGVEFEEGYFYTIVVRTPYDLVEEMLQEKTNFIQPGTPTVVVKQLTKEIVTEAIKAYAEGEGYWLKLRQFGDDLGIAILNKLDAEYREESNEY